MPRRFIGDSILASETLARLSAGAERLFYRLIVLADDFGRYHSGARYVRSVAMPLIDVSTVTVGTYLAELEEVGAICRYEVDGHGFLHFQKWHRYQYLRAKTSKYPPCSNVTCAQTCSETETDTYTYKRPTAAQTRPVKVTPEGFEDFWKSYPKRAGDNPKARAIRAWRARLKQGATAAEILEGEVRYSAWVKATGKEGTETVKQAATFLGPDYAFREAWVIGSNGAKPASMPSGPRTLRLASGNLYTVKPGQRVQFTDATDALDVYQLPNGTLSVKQGATWLK